MYTSRKQNKTLPRSRVSMIRSSGYDTMYDSLQRSRNTVQQGSSPHVPTVCWSGASHVAMVFRSCDVPVRGVRGRASRQSVGGNNELEGSKHLVSGKNEGSVKDCGS